MSKVKDLQREEVRGIFVLGVIASLFEAERVFPKIQFGFGITSTLIFDGLLLYWGAYVFFMALAVSPDWTGNVIANFSYEIAHLVFAIGICIVLVICVVLLVSYSPLGPTVGAVAGTITAFITGILFALFQPTTKGHSRTNQAN